jgi:hypothetical protein
MPNGPDNYGVRRRLTANCLKAVQLERLTDTTAVYLIVVFIQIVRVLIHVG